MNLELHRSDESVWDRADDRINWDAERWLLAGAARRFLIAGLRRRSVAGLALILGSGALAWWASSHTGSTPPSPWPLCAVLLVARAGRCGRRGVAGVVSRERCPRLDADHRAYDHGADQSSRPLRRRTRDRAMAILLAYLQVPLSWRRDSDAHGSRSG